MKEEKVLDLSQNLKYQNSMKFSQSMRRITSSSVFKVQKTGRYIISGHYSLCDFE